MKTMLTRMMAAVVAVTLFSTAARADEPMIGHMVYFTLKDNSKEAKKTLVDACKKYLKAHDGVVYFSAGEIANEFNREVNARDWDVALHVVFKNKASHDKYQTAETHLKFIDEGKANWKSVKVYDSLLTE